MDASPFSDDGNAMHDEDLKATCMRAVLRSAGGDLVQAAEVAGIVRAYATESVDVRQVAIDVVRRLLEEGRVRVGQFAGEGLEPWALAAPDAIAKIESEWQPGVTPGLGDLFWLELIVAVDESE